MKIMVPPIKCQGIKTKLAEWIKEKTGNLAETGKWYEPFMGSGVVGFNVQPKNAFFSDTNPHLIRFYNDIKSEKITYQSVKEYLMTESGKLLKGADSYYKEVRERFNKNPNSLDFLFLNRCCFNGMMRFNSKGFFNVPFCKKPNRLSKSYITKISNQVKNISGLIKLNNYSFICSDFYDLIRKAGKNDIIYCDPPYIDRYSDYFNSWGRTDEERLFEVLSKTESKFIMSTWEHNKYRENIYIKELWSNFFIDTRDHFYHLGASEKNRNAMTEALISNFVNDTDKRAEKLESIQQNLSIMFK
jgi:DNA adenine methylase